MKLRTVIATATTAAVLATSGVAIAGAAGNSGSDRPRPARRTAAVAGSPGRRAAPPRAGRGRRLRLRALIRRGAVAVDHEDDRHRPHRRCARICRTARRSRRSRPRNGVSPADRDRRARDRRDQASSNAAVQAGKITSGRAATKIEQKLPARVAKLVNTGTRSGPKHDRRPEPSPVSVTPRDARPRTSRRRPRCSGRRRFAFGSRGSAPRGAQLAARAARRPGQRVPRLRRAARSHPTCSRRCSPTAPSCLVSGTNGKTTTTALVAATLGDDVTTNRDGANLPAGWVERAARRRREPPGRSCSRSTSRTCPPRSTPHPARSPRC